MKKLKPRIEKCPNLRATIYMAGDIAVAKQVCREFCRDVGLCVNIAPLDYIYTGGEEVGFRVELINYARFPKRGTEVRETAMQLAERLRERLCQWSYSVVDGPLSIWVSHRPEDTKKNAA